MFSVLILCRLRPCAGPRLFKYRHITAPLPVSCLRGDRGKELHDDRRSLLNTGHKTHCLSNRPLSTAPHSEDGKLIYSGSLGSAVRGVKMFSYSTSTASLILMPHILLNTGIGVQSFAMQVAFCGVIGFFTFLTPVLLHLITKGYVIRLYHNPDKDTYAAVTYSVFLTEKKNVFHQSQVKIPAVSKMFTTFYAGNLGLLVNPDLFAIPYDYNHLMGYDKPFRFNIEDIDKPDKH
ncbi:transmembrane protein 70, mitochondrial isoform X1 [Mastacembelus armatus]|uniref:transmembrane protein 70, mitochondrial isoform X1 n=1 Tax=Mastacembelus armatus TaxID=205130 RepID=UPI000E459F87|nr:transmembrane protein 70, mitochondrial isoform X1 [Mastacembelus armatus]